MVSPEPRESKEKQGNKKSTKLQTVIIPEELEEQFQKAETKVNQHFSTMEWDPTNGRILIGGERYVFIRASSLR
ncbi:MAG: hypothetical protein ACTSV6_05225, partial [Candidatus Heimdallarchaeota archaeon]